MGRSFTQRSLRWLCLCFIILAMPCWLVACDKQARASHRTHQNMQGSALLKFEARACDYSKHDHMVFQCLWAERRDGVKHRYPVTIIEPLKPSDDLSNVISIPGGPGQGAQTQADWVLSWADWMHESKLNIRLVVYEPFATYGSSAFWRCAAYENLSIRLAGEYVAYAEEIKQLQPVISECLQAFNQKLTQEHKLPEGLRSLNSTSVSHALGLLMDALPMDKLHLLGTSYGTRVALLAADHPKVESLLLDSPYPFHSGTLLDWPDLLSDAFDLHQQAYNSLQMGDQTYLELFERVFRVLPQYQKPWVLEKWDGSGKMNFVLTQDRLLLLHYHVLYDENMLAFYYRALASFPERSSEMQWVLEEFVTNIFDPTFSYLKFMAVECNDNQSASELEFWRRVERSKDVFTDWKAFLADDVCAFDYFDNSLPVQAKSYSDKPTMIVSGELDPVTPLNWAENLNNELLNSELYIREFKGHGVVDAEECVMSKVRAFWEGGYKHIVGGKGANSRGYLLDC